MSAEVRPELPTREQLLSLVDRTERHVLTPRETHLLRVGVVHLASQLAGAGKAIRRLTGEAEAADRRLAEVLQELAAVRGARDAFEAQLAAVRGELDEFRREAGVSSPLEVACPYCGAASGLRCRSVKGALPPRTPHTARLEAARRVPAVRVGEAS